MVSRNGLRDMAVAFQISDGHIGYNLDRSEEALLVEAFLKVKAVSLPNDPWCGEVERNFFDSDRGVSGRHILEPLNARLARMGEPTLTFSPSDWTPYMRLRYEERVYSRQHLRTLLSGGDREATRKDAAAERDALPPPQEGQCWPKPASAYPGAQPRRGAVAAHLTECAQAGPAPSTAPNVTPTAPGESLDQDGVARILRALGSIEARLGAIEAALGLPMIDGQFDQTGRLAGIEQRLGFEMSPPARNGRQPFNGGAHAEPGLEAKPQSSSGNQDGQRRYIFAPGDEQPY